MFFTQQVKDSSGGLRLLWAVHDWEEQGNRGRREQQCWTGCLLIRIGLEARDPYVVPYHSHLPTACRSAIYTQTPIVLSAQALIFNVPAPLCRLYKHKCTWASPYTHKNHTKSSRTAGVKWTPRAAAAMPEPGFSLSCHQEEWLSAECHSYHAPLHHSGALRSAQRLYSGRCAGVKRKSLPCQKKETPAQLLQEIKSDVVSFGWKYCCCLGRDTQIFNLSDAFSG